MYKIPTWSFDIKPSAVLLKEHLKIAHLLFCYPHFVNINFKANFYKLSPNSGENQLNMRDPSHILVLNDLFVYLWLHQKISKIKDIQISLDLVTTNLTVFFYCFFLLLRSKVKSDAINDLLYCLAKMATKLEMFVKYGDKVYF